VLQLGGYQRAAEILTILSGRTWTRQYVHVLWRARKQPVTILNHLIPVSGFPDRYEIEVNGHIRRFFDMDDIVRWFEEHPEFRR
jgi:hypothetical protein